MPHAVLDHLVVAAERLDDGVRHTAAALGIEPAPGGRHPDMGTHNALLQLGTGAYLEVIAIDPDGGAPIRPRWFGLDDDSVRAALADGPRLLTWVARTDDLDGLVASAPWDTGEPQRMRRGELTWRIAFPHDGRLREAGLLPPLIEWDPGMTHPAERLPDAGCRLHALRATHPEPGRVRDALATVGLGDALALEQGDGPVRLEAEIETPNGRRVLR